MPVLPLTPHLKHYRGSKENLQGKAAEETAPAQRIVDHVNMLIASDPAEMQQYNFEFIALDLGVTRDQVRSAIQIGGNNGISIRVTEEDRQALARYKR